MLNTVLIKYRRVLKKKKMLLFIFFFSRINDLSYLDKLEIHHRCGYESTSIKIIYQHNAAQSKKNYTKHHFIQIHIYTKLLVIFLFWVDFAVGIFKSSPQKSGVTTWQTFPTVRSLLSGRKGCCARRKSAPLHSCSVPRYIPRRR